MGKLTTTCFITLDNVIEEPHHWSGSYFSDETGELDDARARSTAGCWRCGWPPAVSPA